MELSLASVDSDKTIGFVMRNDRKWEEGQRVIVQVAMLYVNVFGETRLRVFNQSFPVASTINQYFKSCVAEAYC